MHGVENLIALDITLNYDFSFTWNFSSFPFSFIYATLNSF